MTTQVDRRLVYLLNTGQRRLQRWIQNQTAETGTTAAQYGLLFWLAPRDGSPIGEASTALDAAPSAISGLVDRMSSSGLIERRADPNDGRVWRLWMQPAGLAALQRAQAGLGELNQRLGAGFSTAEMEVVTRWLASLAVQFPRA